MKSIFVPVEEHTLIHSVFETATLLARLLDGYVEATAITPNVPDFIAYDIPMDDPSFLNPIVRRERAEAARHRFEAFMSAQHVQRAAAGTSGLSFGWREGELADDDFVGSYGRAFDIIVLGRPGEGRNQPRHATVEVALFESGRPVLIVPPTAPSSLGESIAIAWNRSTETARTVALAMPLLARAKRIVVIEIEGWGVSGPTAQDLGRTLRRNGLAVENRTVPNPDNRPGGAILSAAASAGCDLLVKGAYTQSRLRQMILGGATTHILTNTTMPVLMAH